MKWRRGIRSGNLWFGSAIPGSLRCNHVSGPITVSAWVQLPVANTGYSYLASKYEIGLNQRSYSLYFFDMQPRFVISNDGTDTDIFVTSNIDVAPGVWHYLAGTWDGTTNVDALSLYLDGVLVGQDAGPTIATIHNSPTDVRLGCGTLDGGTTGCLRAIIDEVRITPAYRSASWTYAQYLSMTDSMITYSPREMAP